MRSTVLGSLVVVGFVAATPAATQIVPRRKPPVVAEPIEQKKLVLRTNDAAATPTNVQATPGVDNVTITWSPLPDIAGYVVLRSAAAAGPFAPVTPSPVADTQFVDGGLTPGATYYYQVTGTLSDGRSGTSSPVSVTLPIRRMVYDQPRILQTLEPAPTVQTTATPTTATPTAIMPSALPAPVATAPTAAPLFGFADLHTHQLANLAFGGMFFWGSPIHPPGHALFGPCDMAHGLGGTQDFIGMAMLKAANHRTGGFPHYDGWPMWYSINHQQMHVDWLKRAVDGGLRLMVLDAVNNELYCNVAKKAPWLAPNCDDMAVAEFQILQAKGIETTVDNANGGPGKGWYRIVYSAKEARDAISQGKLAVVLGIEVDDVLNCGNCTQTDVRNRLQRVYDLGVRKLGPVHLADNGFGGAALYNDLFNYNNFNLNQTFFTAIDCTDRGIQFRLGNTGPDLANLLNTLRLTNIATPPPYPPGGHCNFRGLTPLGRFLIHEMMSKHMIIDVAHMGQRTLNATLAVTDSSDYPVVASHSGLLDVAVGSKRSERALTNAQIALIQKSGGLIGVGIGGGNVTDVAGLTRIINDCGHSTKAFAQEYLTAVARLNGGPVAFGSDLNGLEKMTAPRFGNDACARDSHSQISQPAATRVTYPFAGHRMTTTFGAMQAGTRTFDYNTDGFAQVGMYPDFIEDLKKIGLTNEEIDPLFLSADAFVRLWEKAESKKIASLP